MAAFNLTVKRRSIWLNINVVDTLIQDMPMEKLLKL
jgi:hypothetical protein